MKFPNNKNRNTQRMPSGQIWCHWLVIPGLRSLREETEVFEASPSYLTRSYLKRTYKNNQNKTSIESRRIFVLILQ